MIDAIDEMRVSESKNFNASRNIRPKLDPLDLAACRKTLDNGSRSFLAASRLLPVQMRNAATTLYAFCREADDLIDLGGNQTEALAQVQQRIDCIYRGQPQENSADRALSALVSHYALPRQLLDALIEGFSWDTEERLYTTIDDVQDYAARVAGTVGAMMAILMGARSAGTVARACDLGVAMQLTNICRDVGEDAQAGRCYLPLDWLADEGIEIHSWLRNPEPSPAIRRVVERVLQVADTLYARADAGLAALPAEYRRGICSARTLYSAIGDEIARNGFDSVSNRAFVSAPRKLTLLATALLKSHTSKPQLLDLPPLPANEFLVNAVTAMQPKRTPDTHSGLLEVVSTLGDEISSVIDLFERLERTRRFELQTHGKVPVGYMATTTQA